MSDACRASMLTSEDARGKSLLIEDAALVLGVSRRTVYYRIRDGRLETVRTRGGSQRVLVASIARLLDEGRHQAVAQIDA
ncbi:MAG: helix-turn-helix domain-containing protein [Vicinamibacterales bacterium]